MHMSTQHLGNLDRLVDLYVKLLYISFYLSGCFTHFRISPSKNKNKEYFLSIFFFFEEAILCFKLPKLLGNTLEIKKNCYPAE